MNLAKLKSSKASLEGVKGQLGDLEVLTTTLKALRMASRYKDRLAMFDLRGVEVDLTLGLPPSVSVRFV